MWIPISCLEDKQAALDKEFKVRTVELQKLGQKCIKTEKEVKEAFFEKMDGG